MKNKQIYDATELGNFVNKYSEGKKDVNLAYGLRPSGVVHFGNLYTLALASDLVNRIGPHISKLVISVLDLDLPFMGDWNSISNKFVKHYKDQTCEGYSSVVERAEEQVGDFMEKVNKEMNVPFEIKKLSDLQKDSRYRKGLINVLESEEHNRLFELPSKSERVEVYPLCRECGTSYTNTIKGKVNKYFNKHISSFCENPKCSVKEYEAGLLDSFSDFSVGSLLGAIRDLSCPVADAHIYGGDYSFPHGDSKEPKVNKIAKVMNIADPKKRLNFVVGPTIFAKGREKMSKSSFNGVDYFRLKNLFKDDYAKRILEFAQDTSEREFGVVDFAVVQDNLIR